MKLINELLGVKYPIIQGGMANIATGKFAAAVSNAGALGLIASGGMPAEALEKEIHDARQATDKPFGVNLMLMNPDADNIADLLAREKIRIITTGAGTPGKYIEKWKETGAMVIPVVASTALARKVEKQGADAVIAEGGESGGHVHHGACSPGDRQCRDPGHRSRRNRRRKTVCRSALSRSGGNPDRNQPSGQRGMPDP